MRVLVTGHNGYIGAVLAPLLADAGHEVAGMDTFLYSGCDFGTPPAWHDERVLDVRDVTPADLEGFDAVVHLAALSNDPLGDLSPRLTHEVNYEGSIRVARAARAAGVTRFLFASSCSMYGSSGTDDLLDEDAPLRPLTPYAESKVRAEEGLFELTEDGFSVVSLRNATVYGISPRLRLDIVLNNLAAWAVTTGSVRLLSDGRSWRPLIHVRDVALVADALLTAPVELVDGQAFNVGSNAQNYTVRELADLLAEVTSCGVSFASDAVSDPRSYRVDFSKLASTFPDLELEWDALRGAVELVRAYREVGLSAEELEGERYVRLRRLRALLESGGLDGGLRWMGEPLVAGSVR